MVGGGAVVRAASTVRRARSLSSRALEARCRRKLAAAWSQSRSALSFFAALISTRKRPRLLRQIQETIFSAAPITPSNLA
jgi:hypothetical protein